MVLTTAKPIKMKKFLSIFLFFLLALSSQAASPSFGSFDTNQFGTNLNMVTVKSGAIITNPVIGGTTLAGISSSASVAFTIYGKNLILAPTNSLQLLPQGGSLKLGTSSNEVLIIVPGTNVIVAGSVLTATNSLGYVQWTSKSNLTTLAAGSATLGSLAITNNFTASQGNIGGIRVEGTLNTYTGGAAIELNGGVNTTIQAYNRTASLASSLYITAKPLTLASDGTILLLLTNGQVQIKATPPTNASPSIMLTRNTTTGAIEDSAMPNTNGIDTAFIRGLIVTKSTTNTIAVSAGTWYHNVSNRVYSLPASTLTISGLAASTMYSVYASVSNSLPVLEAFAENPPTTNYFGTARQRASCTIGRWIGHFITNPTTGVASTVTRETGAGTVTAMYLDMTLTAVRLVSAGTAATYTLVSADPVCPKYASTEMISIFWPNFSTTAAAWITMFTSLDANAPAGRYAGYVSGTGLYLNHTVSHPLNDSNAFYYYLLATAPGVGANTFIDVTGVKYAR